MHESTKSILTLRLSICKLAKTQYFKYFTFSLYKHVHKYLGNSKHYLEISNSKILIPDTYLKHEIKYHHFTVYSKNTPLL